jgi:branched-chain amino acid transport system permease protein
MKGRRIMGLEHAIEVIINGLGSGSLIALAALGFGLIFATAHVFHFAHGVVIVYAGYLTWYLINNGIPSIFAGIIAAAVATLAGVLMHVLVYRPLHRRNAPPLIILLSSVGLLYVGQNLPMFIWGGEQRIVGGIEKGISFGEASISVLYIYIIATAFALFLALRWFLHSTLLGVSIRALANNSFLVAGIGVNVDRLIIIVYLIGSLIATPVGIFHMLDVGMDPYSGTEIIIMATIAVILGGMGSVSGAFFGGLFVGLVRCMAGWLLDSLWQEFVLFVVLLLFMTFRARGFFGKKVAKAEL